MMVRSAGFAATGGVGTPPLGQLVVWPALTSTVAPPECIGHGDFPAGNGHEGLLGAVGSHHEVRAHDAGVGGGRADLELRLRRVAHRADDGVGMNLRAALIQPQRPRAPHEREMPDAAQCGGVGGEQRGRRERVPVARVGGVTHHGEHDVPVGAELPGKRAVRSGVFLVQFKAADVEGDTRRTLPLKFTPRLRIHPVRPRPALRAPERIVAGHQTACCSAARPLQMRVTPHNLQPHPL